MSELNPEQFKEEGLALFGRGEYDKALARFKAAAIAFEEQGDQAGQAEMLNNIGVANRMRGKKRDSVAALEKAGKIFGDLGDQPHQAQTLGNLGDAYAALREYNQAAAAYGRSAALFAGLGDGDRQAQVLRAYSLMQVRRRQWWEAIDLMAKSLECRPHRSLAQRLLNRLLRLALGLLGGH